jgi:hypothetical protein
MGSPPRRLSAADPPDAALSRTEITALARADLEALFALKLLDEVAVDVSVGLEIAEQAETQWLIACLSHGGAWIAAKRLDRRILDDARRSRARALKSRQRASPSGPR